MNTTTKELAVRLERNHLGLRRLVDRHMGELELLGEVERVKTPASKRGPQGWAYSLNDTQVNYLLAIMPGCDPKIIEAKMAIMRGGSGV